MCACLFKWVRKRQKERERENELSTKRRKEGERMTVSIKPLTCVAAVAPAVWSEGGETELGVVVDGDNWWVSSSRQCISSYV